MMTQQPSPFNNHKNEPDNNTKTNTMALPIATLRRSSSSLHLRRQRPLVLHQRFLSLSAVPYDDERRRTRRRISSSVLPSAAPARGSHHSFGNNAAGDGLVVPQYQLRGALPQQNHHQQTRMMSTWLPEVLQNVSLWGGGGWMLKTLHTGCGLEYWSCFAAISVLIRLGLSPFVLYGAQTASRFAKVVPEVQFLVSLLNQDMRKLRENKRPAMEKILLMKTNFQTLSSIYKLHKIHPLSIFISPLLQMGFLSYISIDLRKIVNGRDPELAQELVDAGNVVADSANVVAATAIDWTTPFPWLLPGDLTEPDPWFGLPILAGIIMYANIEVSLGRRSLAGPAVKQADTGIYIKDVFQSLAIFMPCFTCQLPSGIQIYLVTSFVYTMGQSVALRNETFRRHVGLPAMASSAKSSRSSSQEGAEHDEPTRSGAVAVPGGGGKYTLQFIRMKQLEQKAKDIRAKDGGGPLLGKYVLAHGWEISFPGEYRESTIVVDDEKSSQSQQQSQQSPPLEPIVIPVFAAMASSRGQTMQQMIQQQQTGGAFVHGVTAPVWQLEEQQKAWLEKQDTTTGNNSNKEEEKVIIDDDDREVMAEISDEVMEKANRGELPVETTIVNTKADESVDKGPIRLKAKKSSKRSSKSSSSGNKKKGGTRKRR